MVITGPGSDQECAALTKVGMLIPAAQMADYWLRYAEPLDSWPPICSVRWATGLTIQVRTVIGPSRYTAPVVARACAQLQATAGATPVP